MAKGKRNQTRFFALVIIVLVANIAFTLWIFYPREAPLPPPPKELTIITRHDTGIRSYFEETFLQSPQAKEHDITEIEWISTMVPQWPDLIEFSQIDLVFGVGPQAFDTLYNSGLLKKLNSPYMQSVLSQLNDTIAGADTIRYDDDGDPVWVGTTISTYGFTINKEWLSNRSLPFPTHWENLSSPEYGQFLPNTPTIIIDSLPTRIIEIILQKFGWEKGWEILVRMAGNAEFPSILEPFEWDNAGIVLSNNYYGFNAMEQFPDLDLEFRIPINGAIIDGDPIAICSTTSNQAAAEAFIAFVLSPDGQKQWLHQDVNRLPVQESAFDTNIGKNRTDLYTYYNQTIQNSINFNDTLARSYGESINYYYLSVTREAHSELVNCWKKLLDYYFADPVGHKAQFEIWAAGMAEPLVIEDPYTDNVEAFDIDYAKSINELIKTDDTYRALITHEWTEAAKQQYDLFPIPTPI